MNSQKKLHWQLILPVSLHYCDRLPKKTQHQNQHSIIGRYVNSSTACTCAQFLPLHISLFTAPQMSTDSSTISFEEFILLSLGHHVLLLSVVPHATMIMCVLVRLLNCQLWVPVIVMGSTFMQKSDWLSTRAVTFLTSYIRTCFQSQDPVLRRQALAEYKYVISFNYNYIISYCLTHEWPRKSFYHKSSKCLLLKGNEFLSK